MQMESFSGELSLSLKQMASPPSDKVRIRFRKADDLRLVSHHDLMQVFERLLRRARVPFRSTQGFHPKPRMVFALSLALGVVGCEEVVEIELGTALPAAEILHRLERQAPPGLTIVSVRNIDRKTKAQVRRLRYRLAVPASRRASAADALQKLMQSRHCWVDRTRPKSRRLDLRPFLHQIRLCQGELEISIWVGQGGTARPDEVLEVLGLADLLDAGAVLARARLELADEMAEEELAEPWQDLTARKTMQNQTADKEAPARPKPLVPGPLSFES